MKWVPRFVMIGGSAEPDVSVQLTLPVEAWATQNDDVGGSVLCPSGIRTAYVARRGYQLAVPLRLLEPEWPLVAQVIEWGQLALPLLYYPDSIENPSQFFAIYMDAPAFKATPSPEPDPVYMRLLRQTIVVRREDGLTWDALHYGERVLL